MKVASLAKERAIFAFSFFLATASASSSSSVDRLRGSGAGTFLESVTFATSPTTAETIASHGEERDTNQLFAEGVQALYKGETRTLAEADATPATVQEGAEQIIAEEESEDRHMEEDDKEETPMSPGAAEEGAEKSIAEEESEDAHMEEDDKEETPRSPGAAEEGAEQSVAEEESEDAHMEEDDDEETPKYGNARKSAKYHKRPETTFESYEDVVIALMILGGVGFVMASVHFLNHEDADLQRSVWEVVSGTLSIFIAVLLFQALDTCVKYFFFESAALSLQLVVDILQFIFWSIVLHCMGSWMSSDADRTKITFKSTSTILGYICGFAAINATCTLQAAVPQNIMYNIMTCLLPVLALIGLLFLPNANEAIVRSKNDIVIMSTSFVVVQFLRFLINGASSNPASGDTTVRSRTAMGCGMLAAFGIVLAFVSSFRCVTKSHPLFRSVAATSLAWCLYFSASDFISSHIFSVEHKAVASVVTALVTTVLAMVFIRCLNQVADMDSAADADQAIRAFIFAMAVLIGFSWERSFDTAVVGITRLMPFPEPVVKLGLAILLAIIVLPVWNMHFFSMVQAIRKEEEEEFEFYFADAECKTTLQKEQFRAELKNQLYIVGVSQEALEKVRVDLYHGSVRAVISGTVPITQRISPMAEVAKVYDTGKGLVVKGHWAQITHTRKGVDFEDGREAPTDSIKVATADADQRQSKKYMSSEDQHPVATHLSNVRKFLQEHQDMMVSQKQVKQLDGPGERMEAAREPLLATKHPIQDDLDALKRGLHQRFNLASNGCSPPGDIGVDRTSANIVAESGQQLQRVEGERQYFTDLAAASQANASSHNDINISQQALIDRNQQLEELLEDLRRNQQQSSLDNCGSSQEPAEAQISELTRQLEASLEQTRIYEEAYRLVQDQMNVLEQKLGNQSLTSLQEQEPSEDHVLALAAAEAKCQNYATANQELYSQMVELEQLCRQLKEQQVGLQPQQSESLSQEEARRLLEQLSEAEMQWQNYALAHDELQTRFQQFEGQVSDSSQRDIVAEALEAHLEESRNECEQYAMAHSQLQGQMWDLETMLQNRDQVQQTVPDLEYQMEHHEQRALVLEQQLIQSETQLEEVVSAGQAERQYLADLLQQSEDTVDKLGEQVATLRTSGAMLQNEDYLQQVVPDLESRAMQHEERASVLEQQLIQSETQLEEVVSAFQAERQYLADLLQQSEDSVERLEERVAHLQTSGVMLQNKDHLQQAVPELEYRVMQHEERAAVMEQELIQSEAQLEEVVRTRQHLEDLLQQRDDAIKKLGDQVAHLLTTGERSPAQIPSNVLESRPRPVAVTTPIATINLMPSPVFSPTSSVSYVQPAGPMVWVGSGGSQFTPITSQEAFGVNEDVSSAGCVARQFLPQPTPTSTTLASPQPWQFQSQSLPAMPSGGQAAYERPPPSALSMQTSPAKPTMRPLDPRRVTSISMMPSQLSGQNRQ